MSVLPNCPVQLLRLGFKQVFLQKLYFPVWFIRSLPFFLATTTSAGPASVRGSSKACSCNVPAGHFGRSKSHEKETMR